MRWVIFSDLDGSLLNYDDYSFEEARPALEKIKKLEIPLVLTTSKTRTEVEIILGEMGLEAVSYTHLTLPTIYSV
jgi:mannosyl-3-phosphoglycerate phosphatase